jgi:hypothetical protein
MSVQMEGAARDKHVTMRSVGGLTPVTSLATGSAAHHPVAATVLEPNATPGTGPAAVRTVCHDSELRISSQSEEQIERSA